jgi:uncharacterized protein DUF4389
VYPIRYEADYTETQSRPKAFFRLILAIPWLILGSIYSIAAYVVAFLAWFALLFTGRYPQGLYNFNAGFLRFSSRLYAFTYLQTEEWPPFGFEQGPDYPVRLEVDPPLESYNRWKVFFRLILAFPVYVMLYLIPYVMGIASVVAWLHIVFMGRTSGGTHNALGYGISYQLRAMGYLLLLTETIPVVSDQAPAGTLQPAGATAAAARSGAATK